MAIFTDPKAIRKSFCEYFELLFNKHKNISYFIDILIQLPLPTAIRDILSLHVTNLEIRNVLNDIADDKTLGIDEFTTNFLPNVGRLWGINIFWLPIISSLFINFLVSSNILC